MKYGAFEFNIEPMRQQSSNVHREFKKAKNDTLLGNKESTSSFLKFEIRELICEIHHSLATSVYFIATISSQI